MGKPHEGTGRAAVVGVIALAVLLASASLGSPAAGGPLSATSPSLATAATYSILAGSEVTNTGATTISGDVGISPGIGSAPHYSGFGTVTLGGTIHDADGAALTAQADKNAAYTALASQGCDTTYAGAFKELAGETLIPGVYCADQFRLSSGTLTLNGAAADVWIFKSAADLIITGGSSARVIFTGGGLPCNVWWRAVSSATFDANSTLVGNILADTSITFAAGASLNGRALARTAAVTLSSNSITGPTCAAEATATAVAATATATAAAATATSVAATSTAVAATSTAVAATATAVAATATAGAGNGSRSFGEVQVGKFTGDGCTSNLQPEAGVRFSLGSQEFLTGQAGPGIDRKIIAEGTSRVRMPGRAGWRTCARVVDPFRGEIFRQEFGDGETVVLDVPVYDGKRTEVYVTNLRLVTPTPTLTPTPVTTPTPVPTRPTPGALPATLPRTGDPSGMVMVWLALGAAGTALLGFSMRWRRK